MPRITPERRSANRAVIVAAARRCFSRDGFHQTSMPAIAAEAQVAVGAAYRYFSGKDDLIVAVAQDAFAVIFSPVQRLHDEDDRNGRNGRNHQGHREDREDHEDQDDQDDQGGRGAAASVADLIAATVDNLDRTRPVDAAGNEVPLDELLRCAVQTWGEILRGGDIADRAAEGVAGALDDLAAILRRGQRSGTVPADLDAAGAARVVMALLHGYLLQRIAFGPVDTTAFTQAVRVLLSPR
ncbi:helix-turn-helix domain-containing protein [Streptomyces sp. NPDC002564]|uniref:helix-turn-helix domain-containing protein n=1 Tax=Streptomyces sp. NPDC002564 TaxID=3364649 RepID=UPI00369EA0F4